MYNRRKSDLLIGKHDSKIVDRNGPDVIISLPVVQGCKD